MTLNIANGWHGARSGKIFIGPINFLVGVRCIIYQFICGGLRRFTVFPRYLRVHISLEVEFTVCAKLFCLFTLKETSRVLKYPSPIWKKRNENECLERPWKCRWGNILEVGMRVQIQLSLLHYLLNL